MEMEYHQTRLHELFELLTASMDYSSIDNGTNHLKSILKIILEKTGYECLNACKELYKLLKEPGCSVEWFSYALTFLGQATDYRPIGLEHIVEAFAVKKPILQGQWELVACIVFKLIDKHDYTYEGRATTIINNWIVEMMGDPYTCPNPSLRFQCFKNFPIIYYYDMDFDRDFESFISACTTLKIEKPFDLLYGNDSFDIVQLVKTVLERFVDTKHFLLFYQHLSDMLHTQITSIFKDVTYSHALSPNSLRASREMDFVAALFKVTSNCAKQLNHLESFGTMHNPFDLVELLETLLNSLKKSCHTPQLVDVSATCVVDVVENVLKEYMRILDNGGNRQSFNGNVMLMLDEILGKLIGTKIRQIMNCKYQERLRELVKKLVVVRFDFRINALFASWDMAIGLTGEIIKILCIHC